MNATVHRVFRHTQAHPIFSISATAQELHLTFPTVSNALMQLSTAGIVSEATGMQRNRLFRYDEYLKILSEGTQPL
jgi:DNA-binding transcriptional regulator YhcF (GntR family)